MLKLSPSVRNTIIGALITSGIGLISAGVFSSGDQSYKESTKIPTTYNSAVTHNGGNAIASSTNIVSSNHVRNSGGNVTISNNNNSNNSDLSSQLNLDNYELQSQLLEQQAALEQQLAQQQFELEKSQIEFQAQLDRQLEELRRNIASPKTSP